MFGSLSVINWIGVAITLLPFALAFVLMVRDIGWKSSAVVFLISTAVLSVVFAGIFLATYRG